MLALHILPRLVYAVLGVKPKDLCILDRHSTSTAVSQFHIYLFFLPGSGTPALECVHFSRTQLFIGEASSSLASPPVHNNQSYCPQRQLAEGLLQDGGGSWLDLN